MEEHNSHPKEGLVYYAEYTNRKYSGQTFFYFFSSRNLSANFSSSLAELLL